MLALLFIGGLIYALIAHDEEIKKIENEWYEDTGRDD